MMKAFLATVMMLSFGLTVACGDDEDEPSIIADITDPNCAAICDRFDECVREIDVGVCVDQCDDATEVDAIGAQAERCEDCLDDLSCMDSTLCWLDCVDVPEMRL